MEPSKPSARSVAAAVAEAMPPPMSRMSVSRSAMAAARYRRPALHGARALARAADAALRGGAAAVVHRGELRVDEVAGLAGDDRKLEHGGPLGRVDGRGQGAVGAVEARTTRWHGRSTES